MQRKQLAKQLEHNKPEAVKTLFRMAKQSKKDRKDITGMPCIPGEKMVI